MQRFTPRRRGSNWSKINVEKVAKLKELGLMRPAGLAAFGRRTDGKTGVYSFEREATELPPEYEQRLRANRAAAEYFDSRPPWYRRTRGPPGDEREARGDPRAQARAADRGFGRRP